LVVDIGREGFKKHRNREAEKVSTQPGGTETATVATRTNLKSGESLREYPLTTNKPNEITGTEKIGDFHGYLPKISL